MSLFRISGLCAACAACSYLGVCLRGDIVCAGTITALLMLAFFLLALAAGVLLLVAVIRRARSSRSSIA